MKKKNSCTNCMLESAVVFSPLTSTQRYYAIVKFEGITATYEVWSEGGE